MYTNVACESPPAPTNRWERRRRRFHSRVVGLSTLVLLGSFGGCSTETCVGSIACANYAAAQCPAVDGCFPAVPECLSTLSSGDGASRCENYVLSENLCRAASECVWSNATCTSGCAMSADQLSCQAASATYGGCVWAECVGTPTRQCRQYSADRCPTASHGCYVETRGWLGD